ncbi:type II secretion system inner membrane protein GspF [Psychrosphaera sp. B3R10]|uniref:type II secretion system inner membrane protein GspF n=1 Tax=unclassified Psychrosphaera TaxID=2641570 RepID=UPI001C0A2139|nr:MULTISPECIES: type II secretion system inner membrane protein GspF [unclassified Psychrosphaera]MBU2883799.1 type II secretion system inner membrane protein GspF [Psychrosphaera sp. I2R16]MBU2990212.1 type II secretion system inner membrane protein GspF [Psychrosphaera sp. B3R10]
MAAFEYKALDGKGKTKKGILEADTAKQIRQQLREKGLVPLEVTQASQKEKQTAAGISLFQPKISANDLALITRQLATLVGSALTIEAALLAVAEQCDKPRLKRTVMAIRSKVVEGYTLADGMKEFPYIFDHLFRSMVAAGEKSGHLDEVLNRLADYTEQRQATKSQLTQAMIYPLMLTIFAIGIVSFLLASVVPQIVGQFVDSGQALPGTTQFLLDVSDFIIAYGFTMVIAILALLIFVQRMLQRPSVRLKFDRLLLNLPLIGRVVLGVNTARFARTLSILTSSAVPILEGMMISGEVLTNSYIKKGVKDASDNVREGSSLKGSLDQTKIFPPMMLHMIGSGEKSGELEQMLGRAADNQDNEMDATLKISLGLLTPLIVLVMAGMVMFILMAILQPIMEMNNLVGL